MLYFNANLIVNMLLAKVFNFSIFLMIIRKDTPKTIMKS